MLNDPKGKEFRTYAEWKAYFQLDNLDAQVESQRDEQAVFDLAAFYHQTGLLLTKKLLDEDFTMLLIADGFEDRWPVIERIPLLFPEGDAYGGVYDLHARYVHWSKTRQAKVTREAQRIRAEVKQRTGM
jgi:hypothetical protein